MSRGWRTAAFLTALALAAGQARAQVAAVPADRVGPNRAGPPPLRYPVDAPPPAAPAPVAAPRVPAGGMSVRDVYVGADAGAYPARAAPRWAPSPPGAGGLHLVHDAREPLDRAWVHRQFAANEMIGHEVGYDRIAALIQLINLAYLANGYVNSGVIALPQAPDASDGLLRLRLVSGRLVAPSADAPPLAVVCGRGAARGALPPPSSATASLRPKPIR